MTIVEKREEKTVDQRRALGCEARKLAPRASHGSWPPTSPHCHARG
jgi:hypothetical protein